MTSRVARVAAADGGTPGWMLLFILYLPSTSTLSPSELGSMSKNNEQR